MTFSLKLWTKPGSDEVRIYIQGTSRDTIYFAQKSNGKLTWSSKANDTPYKFQTGNHYGKVNKDGEAADRVAQAYGLELGESEFEAAVEIAKSGLEVEED